MPSEMHTKDIVDAEFESFLARCESRGVTREKAQSSLSTRFFMESMTRLQTEIQTKEAQAAQTPKGKLLQQAFELWQTNQRLLGLGLPENKAAYQACCLEYLKEAHHVGVGDKVLVHGWARARGILIENFELSFYSAEKASEAAMLFTGTVWKGKCATKETGLHVCTLEALVEKS